MTTDLMKIITSLIQNLGVQVTMIHQHSQSMMDVDYGLRRRLYGSFDYSVLEQQVQTLCEPDTLLHVKDEFHLFYTMFQFPLLLQEEYGFRYCIIGPVRFQPMSTSEFHSVMLDRQIDSQFHQEMVEYYNRIPLINFYDKWNNLLHFMCKSLLGDQIQIRYAVKNEFSLFESDLEYQISSKPGIALSTIEERYHVENCLLKAVTAGQTKEALGHFQTFIHYKLAPRTPDPLRNQKNMTIILNTLLRKAVQNGSVHPLHIDNLSSQFAIQIESSASLPELSFLSERMIRKYCMLVKNYSRNSYSSLVQTCMDYIDFHYGEDISLDSMAKMCSVSNSYLSGLFKKEVKITLTDYLNSTRIRQALILLNSSSNSVQTISQICGFSTANYFTRIFKKYQGQSPSAYRDNIKG